MIIFDFAISLLISYLFSKLTIKKLRKKDDGYLYVYDNDALRTWILSYMILFWIILFLQKNSTKIASKAYIFLLLSVITDVILFIYAFYLTLSRAKIKNNSIEVKRPFLKDVKFNHKVLLNIKEDYYFRYKRYIYTYIDNGKTKIYAVNTNSLNWKIFNEYPFTLKKLDIATKIMRGPLFAENFSDIIFELGNLNSKEQNSYIESTFLEAINDGKNISSYDADWSIGLSGLIAISKAVNWSKVNLNYFIDHRDGKLKYLSNLIIDEQSKYIYELAYCAIDSIYNTKNEWWDIVYDTGNTLYKDEILILKNVLSDIINIGESKFQYSPKYFINRICDDILTHNSKDSLLLDKFDSMFFELKHRLEQNEYNEIMACLDELIDISLEVYGLNFVTIDLNLLKRLVEDK